MMVAKPRRSRYSRRMIDTHDVVLADLTRAIVERFAPERIVLFGSRVRDDHHPESDYDLMIVLGQSAYSEDVVRRGVQDLANPAMSIDAFVNTVEQFERRRSDVGTLEYVAEHEGRILYSRTAVSQTRRVREKPGTAPQSLGDWIRRAQNDFAMMDAGLRHAPDVGDGIVFHAHQAVEKTLKAVLISRHVSPPRTHELPRLLATLPSDLRDEPQLVEACRGLQALWPKSRYPHQPIPAKRDVDKAVVWARRVREIVNSVIVV